MIVLHELTKTYHSKKQVVGALNKVSLEIHKGDIFGIIGYSGAGKSTLIRCINLLEKPDSGRVTINDIELTALAPKDLRKQREKIGMIFQHFNLMKRRTVYDNVAYPLKGKGYSKAEVKDKVLKLLELVGIQDKVHSYPSHLSGGQKQRVAIARALANDPEVLLCDEATSALDPQNTRAILSLLKEINERLNLTVVIITHQMEVIKEVCNRVAVLEAGEVVEEGSILDIFTKPTTKITKEFIAKTMGFKDLNSVIKQGFLKDPSKYQKTVKVTFVGQVTGQPFISKMSIEYGVLANILFGSIESIQGIPYGSLIVSLTGNPGKIQEAIAFLEGNKILVEVIEEYGTNKSNNAQCG